MPSRYPPKKPKEASAAAARQTKLVPLLPQQHTTARALWDVAAVSSQRRPSPNALYGKGALARVDIDATHRS